MLDPSTPAGQAKLARGRTAGEQLRTSTGRLESSRSRSAAYGRKRSLLCAASAPRASQWTLPLLSSTGERFASSQLLRSRVMSSYMKTGRSEQTPHRHIQWLAKMASVATTCEVETRRIARSPAAVVRHRSSPSIPALLIACLLSACGGGGASQTGSAAPAQITRGGADVAYSEVLPAGEASGLGIFDPALEYDQNGVGWLAYSWLPNGSFPFPYVHTHLATSTDHGASWTYVMEINHSSDATVTTSTGKTLSGNWRYEVPTIARDPDDPGKEWKMFFHRYLEVPADAPQDRHFEYGWIAYRTAPNPTGPWSAEIALFGAGDWPLAPFHQTAVSLDALSPDLASHLVYSEPGALYLNGTLYVSMVAAQADGLHGVVLVASSDHGASWRYLGTVVTNADAAALGYLHFDGSSLALHGDQAFLLVAPVDAQSHFDGTMAFRFSDITKGALERNSAGALTLFRHIPMQRPLLANGGVGGGQSTYNEHNVNGGMLMPQQDWTSTPPRPFRVFNTKITLAP